MSHEENNDSLAKADPAESTGGKALATRMKALEHALAAEKARRHVDQERESRERHRQFGLLLEEMSKAIEKMERRDLELEKGIRAELTRQNRFIYEEFQSRVARLSSALEEESTSIRSSKVDQSDLRDLVTTIIGESTRRTSSVATLLR